MHPHKNDVKEVRGGTDEKVYTRILGGDLVIELGGVADITHREG